MRPDICKRGGAAVGRLVDLDPVEAVSVVCLRRWSEGASAQAGLRQEFCATLGEAEGAALEQGLDLLCDTCINEARRPLMRHPIGCLCVGADEACFARFIASAAEGDREDAMLLASLIVRTEMAFMIVDTARQVGLGFHRLALRARRGATAPTSATATLH